MRFLLKQLIFAFLAVEILFTMPFCYESLASTGGVTIVWNPSMSTNVASYNLYYGSTSGIYTNIISIVGSTNVTVTGLVLGNKYYFASTAVNEAGQQSEFSNETSYLVPTNSLATNSIVQFTANRTNGVARLSVQFKSPAKDEAGMAIQSWQWDFGDGSAGTGQNPSHTYTNPGTYYPSLTVSNTLGLFPPGSGPVILVTNPIIKFSASFTNPCPYLAVQFRSPNTDSGGNPVTNWFWEFGDGATSAAQNPLHIYKNTGTFQPALNATNKYGLPVAGSGPAINVNNPTLLFTASRTSGVSRFTVELKSPNKDSAGVKVKNWHWSFGDGSIGIGQNISHTYTNLETYHPVLTVTNELGLFPICLGPAITVTNPEVKFTTSKTNGAIPLTIQFRCPNVDSGGNTITNWSWQFGDGGTGVMQNLSHTYTNPGSFSVVLITKNKLGQSPLSPGKTIFTKNNKATAVVHINSVITAEVPLLSLTMGAGTFTLAWSTNFTGYTLQCATALTPPPSWMNVTSSPVIINGQNVVTNSIFAPQMFFRLKQ